MSPEADIAVKVILALIGTASSIITWFAKNSFEDMKRALEGLTSAVNEMRVKSERHDERLGQLERRVEALEGEMRHVREG